MDIEALIQECVSVCVKICMALVQVCMSIFEGLMGSGGTGATAGMVGIGLMLAGGMSGTGTVQDPTKPGYTAEAPGSLDANGNPIRPLDAFGNPAGGNNSTARVNIFDPNAPKDGTETNPNLP